MQRFMVIRPGNTGLSKDRSGCDSVWTSVSAAAVPKPWCSSAHEQREEIVGHCSACLCDVVTEYRTIVKYSHMCYLADIYYPVC